MRVGLVIIGVMPNENKSSMIFVCFCVDSEFNQVYIEIA